jgi:CheY-like chemotaxis protein
VNVFPVIIKILTQIQQVVLHLVVTEFKQVQKLAMMETQMPVMDVQQIVHLLNQAGFVRLQHILVLMCALNEQLDIFKIVLLIRPNESLIVVMV